VREGKAAMMERVHDPYAARVHIGRRQKHLKEAAHHVGVGHPDWPSLRQRTLGLTRGMRGSRRALAMAGAAAALAVAVLAVVIDLSPLDPFGPGLGWSAGVILIAVSAALLLVGSHDEGQPRQ
jgi:hypothetical protein